MTIISLITAMTSNRVIGLNNSLPWNIPEELQNFKSITMGKPMIMGRKTFDAIGRRLLPGRKTIVLTMDKDLQGNGFDVAHSIEQALQIAGDVPEVMIIGGAKIYQEFLPLAQRMYISLIAQDVVGDAFFPKYNENEWSLVEEISANKFTLKIFERELLQRMESEQ